MEETPAPINPAVPPEEPKKINKKLILVIAGIVLLFALIGVVVFILMAKDANKSSAPAVVPTPTPTASQSALPAPIFKARTYTYSGVFPSKQNHYSYTITPFTKSTADAIANKLGLTTFNENGKLENYEYSNTNSNDQRGTIVFEKDSGAFSYESYGSFVPSSSTPSATITQNTIELLKYLEIYDETIECDITYEDTQKPGVTFVECHRNWNTLSAPFLNLGGVLNLPERTKITTLTPGQVSPTLSLQNPTITNVSTGGNGLARPNEFNTITVGMYENKTLYSIHSKMRKIEAKNQIPETDLMSAQEAYSAFTQGKGEMALTVPAGTGTVDYSRIYPNNTAFTEIAAVYEMTPAYIDKPFTTKQNAYEPYYLIRGTARLESGYTVRFTQAIPAQKSKIKTNSPQEVSSENNIQILTFTRTPTIPESKENPNPNENGNTPTATIAPVAPGCQLINTSMAQGGSINVPGYGIVNLAYINTFGSRTYSFVSKGSNLPSPEMVSAVKDEYFKALGKSFAIYSAKTASPIEILKVKSNAAICPTLKNESCYNKANESKALKAMEETLKSYSPDELKSMQYPIPLDTILDDDKYGGSSASQLLSWLFVDGYERQQYKTSEASSFHNYCYISGNSPHIFIKSKTSQQVQIVTESKLTYSDPKTFNSTWTVNVRDNMLINNQGASRSSIYYEYDPTNISFNQSDKGYIVEREKINELTFELAKKLGLTKDESNALTSDVHNALTDLKNSDYIKVSIIDEDEVNTLLSLNISPKPDSITRFHLMVSVAKSSDKTEAPLIQKIKRSDYSVLELGAYAKK